MGQYKEAQSPRSRQTLGLVTRTLYWKEVKLLVSNHTILAPAPIRYILETEF